MPPGAISGPSAWYGPELAGRSDWIWRLDGRDIDEIESAIAHFRSTGLPMESIGRDSFPLPVLSAKLERMLGEILDGRGFVLVRGFPMEGRDITSAAIAYLGLGRHFGTLRSSNGKGHLLGHVKDVGADIKDGNTRFYQTNRRLEYHTDSADIVGLLCLQTARSGGESFLASSVTVYNEIRRRRPDLLPAAFLPFPTDRRGEVPEGMNPWFDIPIFNWHAGKLSGIYLRHYIEEAQRRFPAARRLSAAQIEVMDLIDELVNDPAIHLQMAFERGDMQFLHNHQILHSRNDFENWPEPERQRHLLRLWIAPPGGRPLPDVYAARYGGTTPGDRGGIIVPGTRLSVSLAA
ncbi:MAG: TauD/TfdA family dioxygenase [Burkholderiales bacterium]|nr:TauD/TfdA family dioxygenase [Burkholderiales bacterium]